MAQTVGKPSALFLEDRSVLPIDNNPAERARAPIGIGRKELGCLPGATTGAEHRPRHEIIETAKLNASTHKAYSLTFLDRIHESKITA